MVFPHSTDSILPVLLTRNGDLKVSLNSPKFPWDNQLWRRHADYLRGKFQRELAK